MHQQTAVEWLLRSDEPAIRFLTRRDVLGQQAGIDAGKILSGPKMTTLLAGQLPNGGTAEVRTGSGSAPTGGW